MPKKRFVVSLTPAERSKLLEVVSKGRAAAYRIKHANILLAADANGPKSTDDEIARTFCCHRNTVANVRQRFVEAGLDAALDRKPRSAPPVARKLDGHREAMLISIANGTPPKQQVKWTNRMLADELVALNVVDSISAETVRSVLKQPNSNRILRNAA